MLSKKIIQYNEVSLIDVSGFQASDFGTVLLRTLSIILSIKLGNPDSCYKYI